jgi:hypothetical protein
MLHTTIIFGIKCIHALLAAGTATKYMGGGTGVEKEAFQIGIQSDTMWGMCLLSGRLTNVVSCRRDTQTHHKKCSTNKI